MIVLDSPPRLSILNRIKMGSPNNVVKARETAGWHKVDLYV